MVKAMDRGSDSDVEDCSAARVLVDRSTAEQGLPQAVVDAAVLKQVRTIVAATVAKETRAQRASKGPTR